MGCSLGDVYSKRLKGNGMATSKHMYHNDRKIIVAELSH